MSKRERMTSDRHGGSRSELRNIGKTLDDLTSEREGGKAPLDFRNLATLLLGSLLIIVFVACLLAGPPPGTLSTPRESPTFSAPLRR